MQTELPEDLLRTELGRHAQDILRRCVHCGFCLATCPTYELLGNELDSPRGRIYLIKEVLEGKQATTIEQEHLDRCLTCHNCETTCPSGVQYGHLLDVGRHVVQTQVKRERTERIKREGLRWLIVSGWFDMAYRIAQRYYQWLPPGLQSKVRAVTPDKGELPKGKLNYSKSVLVMVGCVQPTLMPSIDAAMLRVLDRLGVGTVTAQSATCCGAVSFHLDAQEAARSQMRRNIDAWWPLLKTGTVEAIVVNASGCGAMIREYGHHLRLDPGYAEKARFVSDKVRDIAEFIEPYAQQLRELMDANKIPDRVAFHPPCTLQHWQKLRPVTENLLKNLGIKIQPFAESHFCCGSAGPYSLLQPEIATKLRDRKLANLSAADPEMIVSSNIGCISHLQTGTELPVRHWIELVDSALKP